MLLGCLTAILIRCVYLKCIIHHIGLINLIGLINHDHAIIFSIHCQRGCCILGGQGTGNLCINLCHCQIIFHCLIFIHQNLQLAVSLFLPIGNILHAADFFQNAFHILGYLQHSIQIRAIDIHLHTATHQTGHIHVGQGYIYILQIHIRKCILHLLSDCSIVLCRLIGHQNIEIETIRCIGGAGNAHRTLGHCSNRLYTVDCHEALHCLICKCIILLIGIIRICRDRNRHLITSHGRDQHQSGPECLEHTTGQ